MLRRVLTGTLVALALAGVVAPAALACGSDGPIPAKKVAVGAPADVVIPVAGMTCEGCANNVQNSLMALDGVVEVSVSYDTGEARVHYDAKVVKVDAMVNAIKAGGYDPGKPAPQRRKSS